MPVFFYCCLFVQLNFLFYYILSAYKAYKRDSRDRVFFVIMKSCLQTMNYLFHKVNTAKCMKHIIYFSLFTLIINT